MKIEGNSNYKLERFQFYSSLKKAVKNAQFYYHMNTAREHNGKLQNHRLELIIFVARIEYTHFHMNEYECAKKRK